MKRLAILGACILLCSSLVARAEVLTYQLLASDNKLVPAGTLLGTVTLTRTTQASYNPTYKDAWTNGSDRLTVKLASLTSDYSTWKFSVMDGTWTPTAGSIYVPKGIPGVPGDPDNGIDPIPNIGWADNGTSTASGSTAAYPVEAGTSSFGFKTAVGMLKTDDPNGNYWGWDANTQKWGAVTCSRTGTFDPATLVFSGNTSDFFRGAYFDTTADVGVNSTLAKLFVTPGSSATFSGQLAGALGTFGTTSIPVTIAPVPVPEPSTMALLITGVLGLIGCAWRKRK